MTDEPDRLRLDVDSLRKDVNTLQTHIEDMKVAAEALDFYIRRASHTGAEQMGDYILNPPPRGKADI